MKMKTVMRFSHNTLYKNTQLKKTSFTEQCTVFKTSKKKKWKLAENVFKGEHILENLVQKKKLNKT